MKQRKVLANNFSPEAEAEFGLVVRAVTVLQPVSVTFSAKVFFARRI